MSSHKIAVMGYGVVGSGVVEAFYQSYESMKRKISHSLDIKYILDIVEHKETSFDEKFISDFEIIVNDPEITVVAEVIGGINPAYDYTKRCLEAGKSVVTSNKELVATKGAELLKIASENGVKYLFEASVGGGIPIIRPLRYCLIGNNIEKICGIVNGTTNFILTRMFEDKMSFEDALSLAQKLGYAERNPSADVDGHDACRKICILSSLILGKHIYPDEVHTEGISSIKSEDVEAAASISHTIKLIAYCKKLDNNKMQVIVAPMLVNSQSRLSNIKDVFNGVTVLGDAVDEVSFYGRGAGKLPTASAVVSDILECVRLADVKEPPLWNDGSHDVVIDHEKGSFPFFLRFKATDSAKDNLVSLLGEPTLIEEQNNQLLFITNPVMEEKFDKAVNELKQRGEEIYSTFRVLY
ncbi:MAG: homoserine dehydrogenase [Oscillospiraceae bacterium]|nr:homoserine dehydrogenase [Oscillospiraceae bacterium]